MSNEQDWFVQRNGKIYGPLTSRQLKQLAEAQKIDPDTLVRRGTTGAFLAARQVKSLFSPPVAPKSADDAWPPVAPPRVSQVKNNGPHVVRSHDQPKPTVQIPPQQIAEHPIPSRRRNGLLLAAGIALTVAALLVGAASVFTLFSPSRVQSQTENVIAKAEHAVALIRGKVSSGTGFIIQRNVLVTNRHVIQSELVDDLKVHFPSAKDSGQFAVKLLYEDPEYDLAFLLIETTSLPLRLAQQHQFRRGEEVVVIGNPGATDELVLENAVSRGVMSTQATIKGQEYYQLGISINSGNSGGPVLDSSGHVIGVVTLKATEKEGLGFCVPLNRLNASLGRMSQLSASEIAVNQSQHRVRVIVRRVVAAGKVYKLAMLGYTEEMEKSINNRKKADDGLNAIRGQVEGLLASFHQSLGDLKAEVATISTDANVPESTRQRFIDLWTNYLELRSFRVSYG